MNTDTFAEQWEDDEPVLVLHGGTPASRQILMRHLRSTSIGFRLVELPMDGAPSPWRASADIVEFFRDLGARLNRLTKKERTVLTCILEGQTNKAISLKLDLTQRAIELRKASLMKKLNSHSHTELVSLITKYETLKQYLVHQATVEATGPSLGRFESRAARRLEPALDEQD